jgi:hypothetical protein
LLRPAAALAALVLMSLPAPGQVAGPPADNSASGFDSILMNPSLGGDPQNPPRFRARRTPADIGASRFTQVPSFGYRPGFGAGTTGFDSSASKKRKPAPPKPGGATTTAPGPMTNAATGQTTNAATTADPTLPPTGSPPTNPTPKQLQAATAPLAGRIYNPTRPGAPPPTPDAETATIATTVPSRRQPPEEVPFDPVGTQIGAFKFLGGVEYQRGYDTNPARLGLPPVSGSWFNTYAPDLLVNSNWDQHALTASLRGTYTTYDTAHSQDRPNLEGKINGRIDVTALTTSISKAA